MDVDNLRQLIDVGQYQEAMRLCQANSASLSVNDSELLFQVGRLYYKMGDYPRASEYFITAAKTPDCPQWKIKLMAQLLLEQRLSANSLIVSVLGLEKFPNDPACLDAYALALFRMKQYSLAEPAFAKACELDGTAEDYRRQYGLCLVLLGRYIEAKYWFDSSATLNPEKTLVRPYLPMQVLSQAVEAVGDWAWAEFHLANLAFEKGSYAHAEGLFKKASEHADPGSPLGKAARLMHAELIRRVYGLQEAKEKLGLLLSNGDATESWYWLNLGLIAFNEDRLEEAEACFSKVDEKIGELNVLALGSSSFSLLKGEDKAPSPDDEHAFKGAMDIPVKDEDEYIILAAADARYVGLFVENFVSSVLHTCGDVPIHLHIINPNQDSAAALDRIRDAVPWIRLSTTDERVSFPLPRPYYATARFLFARDLLRVTKKPTVIADIDAVFIKDPRAGVRELKYADVAVKLNPGDHHLEYPWYKVFATSSIFMPGAGSEWFLNAVARYFWKIYDPTGASNKWWIDQNALYYAWRLSLQESFKMVDLGRTLANRCIEANKPMEAKQEFTQRMAERFPLSALGLRKSDIVTN
ncbi:tetratricopeptide repeat protein [Methylomagnum ishizawai]|uniref:tetratricopeptide repeat protein n=1 Tax=Methylomagnum ishizawai TaxID=1760988 RepID=UPI001C327479|nr:hypothetical protein [Methylomagnum ishizawai]BBL77139.1 hypothetical protein MishRS11D_42370 [Methylomagnum ishizawai]